MDWTPAKLIYATIKSSNSNKPIGNSPLFKASCKNTLLEQHIKTVQDVT